MESIADRREHIVAWRCTCEYGDCPRCEELYILAKLEELGETAIRPPTWTDAGNGWKKLQY